jgi:hypothetical protein
MRATPYCPRCTGLMVRDYLGDYTIGHFEPCWSCVCCGNKVDQTILCNRLLASLKST